MRACLVSVLITLVSLTTAFAENFAFWGFDFEQTPQEQQRILKAQGIGCQEQQGPAFESLNCRIENDTYFGRTYLEKRKARDIFIGCAFVSLCGGNADIIREFTQKHLGFSNYSVSTDTDKSSFSNCYHFSETQKLCSNFSTASDPP